MIAGAAAIRFEHIVKRYGPAHAAVDDVTFDVPQGSCVVILGPSGCGKTTLLETVNRLHEPTSGRLSINGEDALGMEPTTLRRRIGYVIQHVGLFPHMSVEENIGVVPALLGWPSAKIADRVVELLALVHLDPSEYRKRYPRQLSGGQQQRVGLARALAADPSVLLMDEPFGAVDSIERKHLQQEVQQLQSRLRKTILFVTHDVEEALHLADRIVVMRGGKVEQYDTPVNILSAPGSDFVRELVGSDDLMRRLAVMKVESAMVRGEDSAALDGLPITTMHANLREALTLMMESASDVILVVDKEGTPVGSLSLATIRQAAKATR